MGAISRGLRGRLEDRGGGEGGVIENVDGMTTPDGRPGLMGLARPREVRVSRTAFVGFLKLGMCVRSKDRCMPGKALLLIAWQWKSMGKKTGCGLARGKGAQEKHGEKS